MHAAPQDLLRPSPTRPSAIFEHLVREGEPDRARPADRAGVSQPAVSKHLGVLKVAGLVRDRPGRSGRLLPARAAKPGSLSSG